MGNLHMRACPLIRTQLILLTTISHPSPIHPLLTNLIEYIKESKVSLRGFCVGNGLYFLVSHSPRKFRHSEASSIRRLELVSPCEHLMDAYLISN